MMYVITIEIASKGISLYIDFKDPPEIDDFKDALRLFNQQKLISDHECDTAIELLEQGSVKDFKAGYDLCSERGISLIRLHYFKPCQFDNSVVSPIPYLMKNGRVSVSVTGKEAHAFIKTPNFHLALEAIGCMNHSLHISNGIEIQFECSKCDRGRILTDLKKYIDKVTFDQIMESAK